MKLPDIHDFSTTALYQQATQILHSSQTFSIEEETPNEFAALFQTEKELLQIRLQLDDDLTIQSILSSASDEWICPLCIRCLDCSGCYARIWCIRLGRSLCKHFLYFISNSHRHSDGWRFFMPFSMDRQCLADWHIFFSIS